MKKVFMLLAVALMVVSCSENNNETILPLAQDSNSKLMSKDAINKEIKSSIETTGDFDWKSADTQLIYSAVMHGEGVLTVGYGTSSNDYKSSSDSKNIKDELLKVIYQTEDLQNATSKSEAQLYSDDEINVFDVKIENEGTIKALLADNRVRYIEPSGYQLFDASDVRSSSSSSQGAGCGYRSSTVAAGDYTSVAPGAKAPWAFEDHNVTAAWNHSTGSGVTIAVIDTGLSPEQYYMNGGFNDGYSSGKSVTKKAFYVDSWWWWSSSTDGVDDKCGHGTSMAAVATAPRNNNNLPVGVAYNASLVSYRATKNVLLDGYHEQKGVANALKDAARRSDVKIISMSLGHPFTVNRIKDAVRYANNRGKLIFAAGGTSTSFTNWYGVTFPGSMSETVAVTGVKEDNYTRCDACHSGSAIDFTVEMERSSGKHIPVLSYYNGQEDYVGGSSVATAFTAGIAALVWSKNPSWNKDQVLNKMKQAADFYPNRNSSFGYGNIDALQAVQ